MVVELFAGGNPPIRIVSPLVAKKPQHRSVPGTNGHCSFLDIPIGQHCPLKNALALFSPCLHTLTGTCYARIKEP